MGGGCVPARGEGIPEADVRIVESTYSCRVLEACRPPVAPLLVHDVRACKLAGNSTLGSITEHDERTNLRLVQVELDMGFGLNSGQIMSVWRQEPSEYYSYQQL